jgi:hypothetical protein
MANKVQVGAGLNLLLNGANYGIITDFQYQMLSPRVANRGIDTMEMSELAPTTVEVQGTVQVLMLRDDEGLEGRQLTAGLPYISTERYFSLMLQDRSTGFIVMTISYASIEGQSWAVRPRNLVQGQFTFKGLMARTHYNQR